MKNTHPPRQGLILLVVLGMLSLFSLLAISYMVVSSQSRAANFGRARQDFRGTNPSKLLDLTIKQVLRGTNDTSSIWWHNSLLGDLYGNSVRGGGGTPSYETADGARTLLPRLNATQRDNPDRNLSGGWIATAAFNAASPEAPRIIDGHYLRIPLRWTDELPQAHDVWNGRIVSFLEGPLQGHSFRVLRYFGQADLDSDRPMMGGTRAERPSLIAEQYAQYSITVDLTTVADQYVTIGGITQSLSTWLASNTQAFPLCYATNTAGVVIDQYDLLLNSAPQNAAGYGIIPGTNQTMMSALQIPALAHLAPAGNQLPPASATRPYRSLAVNLAINLAHMKTGNPGFNPAGDADESYDAVDFNNPALSFQHRQLIPGELPSETVIPSMHRPALINYIYANIKNANPPTGSNFQPIDLISTIELLQRATGRPLSWRIRNFPLGIPPTFRLEQNPNFSGSNLGDLSSTNAQTPQLDIDWSLWGDTSMSEQAKLEDWVRWLTRGPWDTDNTGSGLADSMWTDINLPLMTSSEGKLLKALAAVYIEDLGGKLDLNASGSIQQSDTAHNNFNATTAVSVFNATDRSVPQGLGYDTADLSLRHFFASDVDYRNYMRMRNAPRSDLAPLSTNHGPGATSTNDIISQLAERNQAAIHNPLALPGLPLSRAGRSGLSLDLFGNPIVYEQPLASNHLSDILDDPYEASVLSDANFDSPYSIAEWERLYRIADQDRSHLPRRLQDRVFTPAQPFTTAGAQTFASATSPRSVSLLAPRYAETYLERIATSGGTTDRIRRVGSFSEVIEAIAQKRWAPTASESLPRFSTALYAQLFPLEFKQNLALDLNRPFGNGLDDNANGQVDEALELSGHGIDDNGFSGFGTGGDRPEDIDEPVEVSTNGLNHQSGRRWTGGSTIAANNVVEQYTYTGELPPPNLTDLSIFYSNPESRVDYGSQSPPRPNVGLYDPAFRDHAASNSNLTDVQAYNGDQSRQLLARHLYCLAQLILPDGYIFSNQPGTPPTPYNYGTPERARYIAQWAVNVVDFRDADHARTRFAYDEDPFGRSSGGVVGWDPKPAQVVWGYEAPDLLLTETLAFHDTRISMDAIARTTGSTIRNFDPNSWNQVRLPEGSLFMEFFCPKGGVDNSQGIAASSLGNNRDYWTPSGQLNLSMVSPPSVSGDVFPVWRVLLTDPHTTPGSSVFDSYKTATTRATLEYETAAAGVSWDATGTVTAPTFNRVVWFTNAGHTATATNVASPTGSSLSFNQVFKSLGTSQVVVDRGGYLVTGPRDVTYIGQEQPRNPAGAGGLGPDALPDAASSYPAEYHPSDQSIELTPTSVRVTSLTGLEVNAPNTRWHIIQSAEPPTGWTTAFNPGLNISEPTPEAYYREPTININTGGPSPFPLLDGYVDRSVDAFANSSVNPEDLTKGPLGLGWEKVVDPTTMDEIRPKFMSKMNWSTAVLQRLANPDRPWHAELNPYLTVDWMPIDLTVFTGEVSNFVPHADGMHHRIASLDGPDAPNIDDINTPEDETMPVDDPTTTHNEALGIFRFNSRQKTGLYVGPNEDVDLGIAIPTPPMDTGAGRTFYSYHTENSFANNGKIVAPTTPTNFEFEWIFNATINAPRLSGGQHTSQWMTLGDLNSRFGLRGVDGGAAPPSQYARAAVYVDASGNPAAPLAPYWPNRDFVSAIELMNVPTTSGGAFMQEFAVTPGAPTDPPMRHLMDFEMRQGPNNTVSPKSAATLLELVGTRNPWRDAATVLDPNDTYNRNALVNAGGLTLDARIKDSLLSIYRAPYNQVPTFLQPGRVNLNTVSSIDTYRGLMWNTITPRADRNNRASNIIFRQQLEEGRVGYVYSPTSASIVAPNPRLNPDLPTQFAGVMRSPWTADQGPVPPLQIQNSVDTGLLRANPVAPTTRLLAAASDIPPNPLLQNLPSSRLKNLTAGDSHTFAVRVTIGFFEYDPSTGLGREYGIDEGTVKRHRAFYVIDRSIPVAYREGYDFNTDKCILMRRIIE